MKAGDQPLEQSGMIRKGETESKQVDGTGVKATEAEDLLEAKRLGERIKFLRQRKGMGLVELGRYTGLSASFLSQLETGRVVPTLRNLARIAMVFSRDMSFFFQPEEQELFRIVRASERQRQPQTGAEEPAYFFESLGQVPGLDAMWPAGGRIAPYVAEFLPGSEARVPRAHNHQGAEFLYVLNGCLKLTHEGQEELIQAGDAVYFHSTATHSYESEGKGSCKVLIVTLPQPAKGRHTGAKVLKPGKKAAAAPARK